MNNKLAILCLLLCSPLAASTGPEAARAGSLTSFAMLADFKPAVAPAPAVPSKPALKVPEKTLATKFVPVYGNVNLSGTGNVMRGAMSVWVNLSGYGTVTGDGGRITSNYTWFNANVWCNVSGGWVHCSDWPAWSVDFYKDGRYVGRGTVRGSINASTYAPSGFFSVNSFTSLSGDVSVTEP